jgi:hypothetical protein
MEEVLRYSEDEYESYGFALTLYKGKYAIANINHCSCFSTEYNDDENTLTLKEVIKLAELQADPRVPDVKTKDKYLLGLYKLILEYRKELKNPKWIGPGVRREGSFEVRIISNKAYDKKKLKTWYMNHLYSVIPLLFNTEVKIENDIIYVHYSLSINSEMSLDEIPGKYYLPTKKYPYVKLELI